MGAPDTRHLAWHEVAEQAFASTYNDSACALWGLVAGIPAALDAIAWHLSELLIPQLPDTASRVIAWLFFLLRNATIAWLFTALLLGEIIILEKWLGRSPEHDRAKIFSLSFFLTIVVLALPYSLRGHETSADLHPRSIW